MDCTFFLWIGASRGATVAIVAVPHRRFGLSFEPLLGWLHPYRFASPTRPPPLHPCQRQGAGYASCTIRVRVFAVTVISAPLWPQRRHTSTDASRLSLM